MRIQSGQLVALGYGKYVRSDDVVAVEPIAEGRGPGRRTLVWMRGLPDPWWHPVPRTRSSTTW